GVHVDAAGWARLRPEERYLVRVHALALVRPHSVFARESAAALLGLPVFGEPARIHLHDPDAAVSTAFGDVIVHTSRDSREVVAADGLRLLAAEDAVVDLARVLPPAFGLAVTDAAVARAASVT